MQLPDQGPVHPGRPTIEQFEDIRREDGTLLSASVPTVTTIAHGTDTVDWPDSTGDDSDADS